jgi:iron complex transport system substrate-binding protein
VTSDSLSSGCGPLTPQPRFSSLKRAVFSSSGALTSFIMFLLAASILGGEIKPRPEASGEGSGRVVLDMSGYPSRFDGPVNKALILTPVVSDFVTVDQTETNILAVPMFIKDQTENSFLKKLYPGLLTKKTTISGFGQGVIGCEEVLALQPDALIVWEHFSQLYRKFGFRGLVAISDFSEGKDKLYDFLGRLADKKEWADFLVGRGRRQLEVLPHLVPADTQSIGFLVMHRDGFRIFPMIKDFNRDIALIKGRNYGENFKRNIGLGLETVLLLNPEFIFLYWNVSLSVEDFCQIPAWRNLKAVRLKQVYKMPFGSSKMEGPVERPLLYYWILLITRPETRTRIHFREMIKSAYLEVYGYKISDDELDEYLLLCENSASANYEMIFSE